MRLDFVAFFGFEENTTAWVTFCNKIQQSLYIIKKKGKKGKFLIDRRKQSSIKKKGKET